MRSDANGEQSRLNVYVCTHLWIAYATVKREWRWLKSHTIVLCTINLARAGNGTRELLFAHLQQDEGGRETNLRVRIGASSKVQQENGV